jgi:hypothetical protein
MPTLKQLVALFVLCHGLAVRDLAGQDACREARARFNAALATMDYGPFETSADQLLTARFTYETVRELREKPDLLSELLGDPATNAEEMRRFADQARLPNDVRALIAANRPEEFWRRAAIETRTRHDEQTHEIERQYQQKVAGRVADLVRSCPENSPAPAAPPSDEGPLPVARHPVGLNSAFSNAPLISSELITRWIRAYQAWREGSPSYWRAGRMTQRDYLDISTRIELWQKSSGACTRTEVSGELSTACRTAPVRIALQTYFNAEEIAAFEARQDDLGNALDGKFHLIRM